MAVKSVEAADTAKNGSPRPDLLRKVPPLDKSHQIHLPASGLQSQDAIDRAAAERVRKELANANLLSN